MGVSGAIHINQYLLENSTLKNINLSANKIEVDGARNLAKVLMKNKTLEFVDIGFNKIRDEGFRKIGEALGSNTENKVKCLGVRGDMLTDASFLEFFTSLKKNSSSKLNSLLFKKNAYIDKYIQKRVDVSREYNADIFVDIFRELEYAY